ncbi:unnamed protein product [Ectocarpus sp. CCAP 1310/34]|nr:unnamed protein product [Ectocarpus sp. CCAP 1310/34]
MASWCRDAALGDPFTHDPWEVTQSDCYNSDDGDYTRLDEISITCSCGTTPAPTAPSCDDSFSLDVDYFSGRDGCYELNTAWTINGKNAYFLNGIEEDVDSSVVYAADDMVDDNPGVGSIPASAPSATSRAMEGTQLPAAMQYPEALHT